MNSVEPVYRVACFTSHPIQYQAPLFRYISSRSDIDLTVFFFSDLSVSGYHDRGFGVPVRWDVPLLDGYRHAFLPTLGRSDRLSFWRPLVRGISGALRSERFDAAWIHGYAHHGSLQAILAAKRLGLKVLLRGESHLGSGKPSALRRTIKGALLPRLFRWIDGFLAIGSRNAEYYRSYGVSDERIFSMPYAVDNDFFRSRAESARPRREQLRSELGLSPGRPIVLFASKLEHRKRPADLFEAYRCLSPGEHQEPKPYLLFLGDGEERAGLEARAGRLGWSSVKFLGFKNQSELPAFYDICDVFVLPSEREPWGLVVNEVMNAGKPVIVSDQVGGAPDLVADGENGFVVPVGDVAVLATRLRTLTENPALAERMGAESLRRISRWDFESDYDGLTSALSRIVGDGPAHGRRRHRTQPLHPSAHEFRTNSQ